MSGELSPRIKWAGFVSHKEAGEQHLFFIDMIDNIIAEKEMDERERKEILVAAPG